MRFLCVNDRKGGESNLEERARRGSVRDRHYEREGQRGCKDQDILTNKYHKRNMIIRMKRVKRLNISVGQIVITVFLMRGHLRSDYKSRRSMIKSSLGLYFSERRISLKQNLFKYFLLLCFSPGTSGCLGFKSILIFH